MKAQMILVGFIFMVQICDVFPQSKNPIFTIDIAEVSIDQDYIINDYFKELVDSDSIQIFKLEKFEYDEDERIEVRLVFIDYRNSTRVKDGYRNVLNEFNDILKQRDYFEGETHPTVNTIMNAHTELNDIYVPVFLFKNEFVGFEGESYRKTAITDSGFYFHDWEGWHRKPITLSRYEKDYYTYNLMGFGGDNTRVDIYQFSEVVQIWRMTIHRQSGTTIVLNRFMAPLSFALTLPTLESVFSAGVDGDFDGFDNFNYEQYFEQ